MAGLTEPSELRLPPNPEIALGAGLKFWHGSIARYRSPPAGVAGHSGCWLGRPASSRDSTAAGRQTPRLKGTSDAAVCSEVSRGAAVLKSETGKVLPIPSDRGLVLGVMTSSSRESYVFWFRPRAQFPDIVLPSPLDKPLGLA
jgi:hypothetical protein